MTVFSKIYRFAWFILVILLIFFDRQNIYWVVSTIILLLIVSVIAVLRAIESRNQWRNYLEEEDLNE